MFIMGLPSRNPTWQSGTTMLKSNNMYESGIFAFQFRVTEGMTQEGKNVVFNL